MLQEGDRQGDGAGAEDQVTAFLEEELRRDPPRLDFDGFQGLVRAFSEAAEVSADQVSPHPCKSVKSQRCNAEGGSVVESLRRDA